MRQMAYRKLLPVVQLALYLLLIWYGCPYRPMWQHRMQHWITQRPAFPGGWDLEWIDGSPSLAEQLALGINAPAAFGSMLMMIPFDSLLDDGASREFAMHTMVAFGIPVLWYLIGRRLEGRTVVPARPSMIGRLLTVAGLAVSALVALLMFVALVAGFGEVPAARLLILLWAISGTLDTSKRIRRWRLSATNT
jgi:hypothetical protein